MSKAWINFSYQDKTWAEFSSLEAGCFKQLLLCCLLMLLINKTAQLKVENLAQLKVENLAQQFLGSLPLDFALPAQGYVFLKNFGLQRLLPNFIESNSPID
jgi:hypothetical protein